MPYIPHTPESLVGRADASESTTPRCNGITSNGRACRRVVANADASPTPSPSKNVGASSKIRQANGKIPPATQLPVYCWQHKHQERHVAAKTGGHNTIQRSKTRTSIDSLADKLGVLEVSEEGSTRKGTKGKTLASQPKAEASPKKNQEDGNVNPMGTSSSAKKRRGGLSLFFCFQAVDDENLRPARRSTITGSNRPISQPPSYLEPVPQMGTRQPRPQAKPATPLKQHSSGRPVSTQGIIRPRTPERRRESSTPQSRQTISPFHTPNRPSLQNTPNSSSSQTQSLLSLIPPTLSPQTTASLLNELAKPISESDTSGYIYIFLGASANSPMPTECPSAEAVTSALASSPKNHNRDRSVNDIFRPSQTAKSRTSPNPPNRGNRKVILKIGRTSNVHRRLNEWISQCSLDLKLIRYYPYTSSSSSSSSSRPSPSPGSNGEPLLPGRKAPHIHRVERLIHLELSEMQIKGNGPCETCGKEHRELFEVGANVAGLRVVDDCIRRWVEWAERQN